MIRPGAIALLLVLGLGAVQADTPMWINSPQAAPYLPALQASAERSRLPVALLAELIGAESSFNPAARSRTSSAAGLGQQIVGNDVMRRHRLNRLVPAQSIEGAAIELRDNLDRLHSLDAALRGYGTTAGLSVAHRKRVTARMERAARYTMPATQRWAVVIPAGA